MGMIQTKNDSCSAYNIPCSVIVNRDSVKSKRFLHQEVH
jgi:hypothetical protein